MENPGRCARRAEMGRTRESASMPATPPTVDCQLFGKQQCMSLGAARCDERAREHGRVARRRRRRRRGARAPAAARSEPASFSGAFCSCPSLPLSALSFSSPSSSSSVFADTLLDAPRLLGESSWALSLPPSSSPLLSPRTFSISASSQSSLIGRRTFTLLASRSAAALASALPSSPPRRRRRRRGVGGGPSKPRRSPSRTRGSSRRR